MNNFSLAGASFLCVLALAPEASFGQDDLVQTASKNYLPSNTSKALTAEWISKWEKNIIDESRNHYCEKEMGEEIGWLISPLLGGYYYGYLATGDKKWVDMLVKCADAWIARAVTEPDGYLGWPKDGASGTPVDGLDHFYADSLVGEAMVLRFIVLMSKQIVMEPRLTELFGAKASSYMRLSEDIFEKWDQRGAWRNTERGGMISVVLPFGIDRKTGTWTSGYERRNAPGNGFSHPTNKANLVATWLLAMSDATQKLSYKERAEKWFLLMKSRMLPKEDGTFRIWNYWQPAGPWDYKLIAIPKHWIGIHPNPGYYSIDVESIVTAYEHGVVFNDEDIQHLIETALAGKRDWVALSPFSNAIQQNFEETNKPDSWAGLSSTPRYLPLRVPNTDSNRQ